MSDQENLLLLLQRPNEPSFFPKDDGNTVLDIPTTFVPERYQANGINILSRNDFATHIPIMDVSTPDLSFASSIGQHDAFSLFIPKHQEIAGKLIDIFMKQKDLKTLMAIGAYVRDRINVYLFQYAYSVALQHRPDTRDLPLPSVVNQFPDQFVDPAIFPRLREESKLPENLRLPIEIPRNYTANDNVTEQRMAYFREDIGINIHHWHWHLVYPGQGPDEIVNKDRRGELFYYMHSQVIARYNADRFACGLEKVKNLSLDEPVKEAYFPKIIRSSNQRSYPSRVQNCVLRDVNRDEASVSIDDLKRWRDRIFEAIDSGFVYDVNGVQVPLDENNGIEILSNLIEASKLSINEKRYGNLHNYGHNIIAFVHDPDGNFLEDFGVMGDVSTAMRDPVFYRWHGFLDSIWARYKMTLPEYPKEQLEYKNIHVNAVSMQITKDKALANTMITFWQKSKIDLGAGVDFGSDGSFYASFTHLQHAPFIYRIVVNNSSNDHQKGTCRIFLAPKFNEKNIQLSFMQQRQLFIEMDKFTVNLKPGDNLFVRDAVNSSVTIPYERTFRKIDSGTVKGSPEEQNYRFCGCGWPDHMLLPKGTAEGMKYDIFVMVSNYADDLVIEFDQSENCSDAHSFCGLKDKKYPDKRKMGFPFDRPINGVANLHDFSNKYTNMGICEVTIKFVDTIVDEF